MARTRKAALKPPYLVAIPLHQFNGVIYRSISCI